jgi:hypothetical protein
MKIGEKVAVLDDDIVGVITAITGNEVTLLTSDDFEMHYSKNELVRLTGDFSKQHISTENLSEIIYQKETKKRKNIKKVKSKERISPPMVVDLHIHQLVTSEKGLSNYDILTIQMDEAKRQLEFAIRKRIQRIVFIHGIGEGVLKVELDFLLRRYENLQFYDADYQKYGRGATEVYIFQNKQPS